MDLAETVGTLMQEQKGILSAGETTDVELERMKASGADSEGSHLTYRELLFTAPGIEEHLSGVLMSAEAVDESTKDGTGFLKILQDKNILAGVRMGDVAELQDANARSAMFDAYRSKGISFVSFTAHADVSDDPLADGLQKDIDSLALCVSEAVMKGIVPVAELDVSMEGMHTAAEAEDSILEVLSLLSDALLKRNVPLAQIVVGVSMAVAGGASPLETPASEAAERTIRAVTTGISADIGGVVFLSDSQTPEEATANLNALARLEPLPWRIAFCFSRALHEPVLAAWKNKEENIPEAQAVFIGRLSLLSRADAAGYSSRMEKI